MIKSILARRLAKLVIVVAIVPTLLLLILSISFLYRKSADNFSNKLQMSVKNLGLDLEDRLEIIGTEINFLSNNSSGINLTSKINFAQTPKLTKLFKNIYLRKENYVKALTKPTIQAELQNISSYSKISKPTLIITHSKNNTNMFIITTIKKDNSYLIGEINTNFLWQISEAVFSKDAALCVLYKNQIIACDNDMHKENYIEDLNADDYLSASWNTFKTPSVDIPNLKIISWAKKSMVLRHLFQYISLAILAILAAMMMITFISRHAILSIVAPIKRARKHILKYIGIIKKNKSSDELEFLVDSLDYVSDELGQQHDSLSTMAKIDKIILSSLDLNSIMDTLKNRLKKLMHAHTVNIHIKNLKKSKTRKNVFKTHGVNNNHLAMFNLTTKEVNLIFKSPHHLLIDNLQSVDFKYFTHIKGSIFTLIIPVFLDEQITALISLHFSEVPNYKKPSLKQTRELANRFAVAIANAAKEDKLYHQAHFDLLTDLPNRLFFHERLDQATEMAKQTDNALAILFIDLDKFKSLNDSFGHSAGDEYLKKIAIRIKNCLKSDDTVARFGGDEFVVILPNLQAKNLISEVSNITENIQHEIAKPCNLSGNLVVLNSSIGISIYPEDADNAEDLLKAADAALYYAKAQDKDNYQFYSIDISHEAKELFLLENNLNGALANDEFELYFQPRINVDTNQVVSAEALIRWQKNDTYISPEDFIPIAENNGLIQSVGEWILHHACFTAKRWHNLGLPIRISINLSAKQFQNTALITRISDILLACKLSPSFLELELTENILMQNNTYTIASLRKLQDMGIIIAIDDFGTGYSSLSYLKYFSIDVIKIDKSFIKDIHQDQINKAIVSAILTLSKNLNIKTVAEGVENKNELQWLIDHNCKEIQGYLFSEPLNASDFEQYLLKQNAHRDSTIKV